MGEKFIQRLIGIIFSVVGAVILMAGIFNLISYQKFKKVAVETTGEIVSVSRHVDYDDDVSYRVYISYNVNGKKYEGNYSSSSYVEKGTSLKVYYDKNNPSDVRPTISSGIGVVMCAFGGIICAVGLGMVFHMINNNRNKKSLLENGQRIFAEFKEVNINYSYSVNNRHPYLIICEGTDVNGEWRTFKSENIWNDPAYIIRQKNITSFPIYIDINNPKKYYMDISDIEEKSNDKI